MRCAHNMEFKRGGDCELVDPALLASPVSAHGGSNETTGVVLRSRIRNGSFTDVPLSAPPTVALAWLHPTQSLALCPGSIEVNIPHFVTHFLGPFSAYSQL